MGVMIELACPVCRAELESGADGWTCLGCAAEYALLDGIGRFLPPDRAAHYEAFLRDYTTVRMAEGRGHENPSYFRRLPEPTEGDPLSAQWAMRAKSWSVLQRLLVPQGPPSLRVVDVGAGMGWLSNRVAQRFHDAAAVDLTVDPADGLGAARHFGSEFGRFQAEMDALPFAAGAADLVIFNASLHYSTGLEHTLAEALRVLAPNGRLVVMDTPIYRRERDGAAMVAERHADFERRFGTRSDSIPSINFVTMDQLREVGASLGLRWQQHSIWYGWTWAWRPWRARLRRRRAPSRFALLVAHRADRVV
jgi:SAM-dependent methyltransferase